VIILLTVGPNTHGSLQPLDNIIPIGRELVLVVPRGLSEQRLVELIIERCGFFGQVTNIRLMPALPDGRLVFVEMGNTKQSNQVSRAMGGTVFGYRTTAIRLAYFGQRSPSDVEKISPVLKAQATKH